ncbi:MAG: cadmium-translocating P-type ATPase, partial [Oscillibacter sp.]|nr:cadmium-translocating P-type ATPase [Oscillibacter sp.]
MTRKQRGMLLRILTAGGLLLAAWLVAELAEPPWFVQAALFLVPYWTAGWDVLYKAARNLRGGQPFDENFLMAIATIGAFAAGEYAEAVFVMVFYQIGEWFQSYAVGRSRQSIAALMDIRPDTANVVQADGTVGEMDPEDVEPGMVVVIKPGERVPVDGVVLEGTSSLDTSALTGEPLPRDVNIGDSVVSGCVNQTGVLRVEVTRAGEESTVARILDLVENAGEKKAVSEQFITRFARYYTPCVVFAAAALAVIPPLIAGNWGAWFHRGLIFLVVSCPCALVISVPLSFFGGIGGASKRGILVKGSVYLEALAKTEVVVFDKTGTLTCGKFTVTSVEAASGFTAAEVLELAALAEAWSSHPIALSLRAAYAQRSGQTPDSSEAVSEAANVEELAGHGVRAAVRGRRVCVGNRRLMEGLNVPGAEGLCVYVSADGVYAGRIHLEDLVKPDARAA